MIKYLLINAGCMLYVYVVLRVTFRVGRPIALAGRDPDSPVVLASLAKGQRFTIWYALILCFAAVTLAWFTY